MALLPVAAQQGASATRFFDPASVAPGGRVVVTIKTADYGQIGGVTETLPAGFGYVSSSLDTEQVRVTGQQVRFTLQGTASFTYTVDASSEVGSHTFSGTLRDSNRMDTPVGGDSGVTVEAATPVTVEPTAAPTAVPTAAPTLAPTVAPTVEPRAEPTAVPTAAPTLAPTVAPTVEPRAAPTAVPTAAPTLAPTVAVAPNGCTHRRLRQSFRSPHQRRGPRLRWRRPRNRRAPTIVPALAERPPTAVPAPTPEPPGPVTPVEEEGGLPAWVIILIIVVVLAVIIGAGTPSEAGCHNGLNPADQRPSWTGGLRESPVLF